MGRTKRPRQSMQVFLDQKNQTVNVPLNLTNALMHMQDTGQLHYSTAILPETTFAAPKAHVPGHVHLLHKIKPGSSVLAQKAIKAKFGDDAFTPQGALTVVTPEVPLFAPPEKIAKLEHTGTERSAILQIRQETVRRQPPLVLPLPNVPLAYQAPPQPSQAQRTPQPQAVSVAPRPMPPSSYVYRPPQPQWRRILEEVRAIPATDGKKIKDKIELAIRYAEKEEDKFIEPIFAMENAISPKVFRGENAEATKAAVIAILNDF